MTLKQMKELAKAKIKGKIGILFLIMLVNGLIISLASCIPVVGQVVGSFVIAPAFSLAVVIIYLKIAADDAYAPELAELFNHVKQFWLAFKVMFFTGLFTALWSLLFYIPGIIKALSYSQAMYIIAENPEIGALEAINRSKAMMEGHKMELFTLMLSFIGWIILGMFTFGLLYIWLMPYMNTTMALFHKNLTAGQAPSEENAF